MATKQTYLMWLLGTSIRLRDGSDTFDAEWSRARINELRHLLLRWADEDAERAIARAAVLPRTPRRAVDVAPAAGTSVEDPA